jgi:general secretion pathway protein E
MGVEPFLLASTLRVVIAQRLVRQLCSACRRADVVDAAAASLLGVATGAPIYRATGCPTCAGTGYAGRVGLFEVVRVDDTLRHLISANATEDELSAHAFAGTTNLAQAAREAVAAGLTTLEEAVRVIRKDGGPNAHV